MRLDELGEFGLIARIAEAVGAGQESVVVGIGDDAAVLEAPSAGSVSYTHLTLPTILLV